MDMWPVNRTSLLSEIRRKMEANASIGATSQTMSSTTHPAPEALDEFVLSADTEHQEDVRRRACMLSQCHMCLHCRRIFGNDMGDMVYVLGLPYACLRTSRFG